MSKDIQIKKGLDIHLVGAAKAQTNETKISATYKVSLEDFHGLVPKLSIKEGAQVQAGEPLFYDKNKESIQVVSPVSGTLTAVERGDRRRILSLSIASDGAQTPVQHPVIDIVAADAAAIKAYMLMAGVWPFVKQRPYDVIADPDQTPKGIFISAVNTAPLAVDLDYVLKGQELVLQAAVSALSKLTSGSVHLSIKDQNSPMAGLKDCEFHVVSGPHPSGLVGTLINKVDPINKGEVVWTISAQDLLIIGNLLQNGVFNATRTFALAGSAIKNPQYFTAHIGAELAPIIHIAGVAQQHYRLINGDVLTGLTVDKEGNLGYRNTVVTAIPEGDDYDFFGWNKPEFNKMSTTRALTFSWLFPKKKYDLNTNTNGEHRAFVVTGGYEEVFPLDIYPLQLLKSCMVNDLDEMEQLGLYEVAPEDFALTEFVCISKQPHQQIIREGLDFLQKEIG
jgi:Na+-transporting NADH:ubiquinone oxidoreductase subunit A